MIKIVSVVRDKQMYSRCVASNPFLEGCELHALDNTVENLPVPVQYNRFVERNGDDCWLVFCHEDWKAEAPLAPIIEKLDPAFLYGPIGVFVEEYPKVDVIVMKGSLLQTAKNGKSKIAITGKDAEGRVDTFDCQCLIVHSSLFGKYDLRFDEALAFDMYVEDFCVAAFERHGIESRAVNIPCRHSSTGKLSGRFFDSLEYVRNKYSVSKKRYATIVGHLNTFGGDASRPVFKWKRLPWIKLRYMLAK